MKNKNLKTGILLIAILLWPLLANAQEDNSWCPEIVLAGKAAEIFKLDKCQYISGLTIKLIYNGKFPYPSSLSFTLLDLQGNKIKGDQNKKVFGPQQLTSGQYGIFTIQNYGNDNPSKIRIEGTWKNNKM
jgi:hypothetical protein